MGKTNGSVEGPEMKIENIFDSWNNNPCYKNSDGKDPCEAYPSRMTSNVWAVKRHELERIDVKQIGRKTLTEYCFLFYP